jgi:hypothetical protein
MEAVKQDIEDYVLLAHAGHGVNSYAIHVFVVHGPLALFLQVPWGGVYMDPKKSARRLADVFDCAGQLITAVREADTTDRLEPGKRLFVMVSLGGSTWRWLDRQATGSDLEDLRHDLRASGNKAPAILQEAVRAVKGA